MFNKNIIINNMDKCNIEGRIDRNTGQVIKRKLRVAAYARVSTTDEEQLNN